MWSSLGTVLPLSGLSFDGLSGVVPSFSLLGLGFSGVGGLFSDSFLSSEGIFFSSAEGFYSSFSTSESILVSFLFLYFS